MAHSDGKSSDLRGLSIVSIQSRPRIDDNHALDVESEIMRE